MKQPLIWVTMLFTLNLFAQKEQKKVIIIDKDSNVQKISGDDDKVIIVKTIDGNDADISDIDVKHAEDKDGNVEYLTININNNNGNENKEYVLTSMKDGKKEVLKWDGSGEMPDAIKGKMKSIEMDEKMNSEDGKKEVIIEIDGNDNDHQDKIVRKKIRKIDDSDEAPKVRLGVMIDDNGNGVEVASVINDSPAKSAGIEADDKILKLDGEYIFTSQGLFRKMATFSKGDKIKVVVLRNGKEKEFKVQL